MREITSHVGNSCNDQIKITARDEPGLGGDNHLYYLEFDNEKLAQSHQVFSLYFQRGPIATVGVNGITHEALLAVIADRLQAFQNGKFQCGENERALYHVREAMMWLKHRTERRAARGIEGTHATDDQSPPEQPPCAAPCSPPKPPESPEPSPAASLESIPPPTPAI